MLHSLNHDQRLYVVKCSAGFTCLGFDVCERWGDAIAKWIWTFPAEYRAKEGVTEALSAWAAAKPETEGRYAAYKALCAAGALLNKLTGKRADYELTPQLVGLEGRRVEVTERDGTKRRFNVGKSTGWAPCHLEIKTRRSMGGCPAYVPEGATVRVVS